MFVMALSSSAMACSAALATVSTSLRGWPCSKLSACRRGQSQCGQHSIHLGSPNCRPCSAHCYCSARVARDCIISMVTPSHSSKPLSRPVPAHLRKHCGWRQVLQRAHELQNPLCLHADRACGAPHASNRMSCCPCWQPHHRGPGSRGLLDTERSWLLAVAGVTCTSRVAPSQASRTLTRSGRTSAPSERGMHREQFSPGFHATTVPSLSLTTYLYSRFVPLWLQA